MGVPLALGGWAEARHRDGLMTRRWADGLIIIGLIFAAVEIGFFHLGGGLASGVFLSHFGLIVMALVTAFLRGYQGMHPASVPRALLISGAIAIVAMILFTDSQFQQSGTNGETAVAAASEEP
jgi:hypothetical protein